VSSHESNQLDLALNEAYMISSETAQYELKRRLAKITLR